MTCNTCNMTINNNLNVFAQQWNRAGETEEEEIHVGCVEGGGIMERKSFQNICVCVLSDLCVLPDLCVCNLLEVKDKTIIRNSKSLLHTQIVKYESPDTHAQSYCLILIR